MPNDVPRFDDWIKTRTPHEPSGRGLDPQFQSQVDDLLKSLQKRGLNARLTEGYRSPEKQNEYFAQGRTKPGRIITNATGQTGKHPRGVAADIDLLDASGKPLGDNDPAWQTIGEEAATRGLTWGGKWKMRDMRHVELNQGSRRQSPKQPPKFDEWKPDSGVPKFDDWAKDSGQTLPPTQRTSATRPASAKSVPKAHGRYAYAGPTAAWARIPPAPGKREMPPLIDKTIPDLAETLVERSPTFGEDRALRKERKKVISQLEGRAGAASDFKGEEYQNFLRLNRSFDSPRQRQSFLELKAKQSVASAGGSPYEALRLGTEESERQNRVAQLSTGQKAAQIPKSLVGGLASGVGGTLKGISVIARKGVDQIADTTGFDTRDSHVYRLGEYISESGRDNPIFKSNPDLEQEFLLGKTPNAIGQSALFLLGGWASQSPKLAVSMLGAGMSAGDAYDEVRRLGGTDDQATNAGLLAGAILGPSELLGMRGALKALEGTAGEATLRAALKTALREGRKDAIENALQEVGQTAGTGLITGGPRTWEDLIEAGTIGAISSGITTPAVTLAAGGRRAAPQVETVKSGSPSEVDTVTQEAETPSRTIPETSPDAQTASGAEILRDGGDSKGLTGLPRRVRDLSIQAEQAYLDLARTREGLPDYEQVVARHQQLLSEFRVAKEALDREWKAAGVIKGSDLYGIADKGLQQDFQQHGIKPDDTLELRSIPLRDLKTSARKPFIEGAKTRGPLEAPVTPGPIVLSRDLRIADGNHRADGAYRRGEQSIEAWIPRADGADGGTGTPQRFYHRDFGEVEILEDQTGAGRNRYRVAEVSNPDVQHFVKKSRLTGRGNERMVPVKPEPSRALNEAEKILDTEIERIETKPPEAPAPIPTKTAATESQLTTPKEVTDAVVESSPEAIKPPTQAPGQVRTAPTKVGVTAYGLKSDLSLSQFVRKMGGIVPTDDVRGEIDRIRLRESGSTGLVNQKAHQGNIKQSADIMMQAANDAGYRDKNGQPFEKPGDFLYAVERDVMGDKVRVLTGAEDFSAAEAEYYAEQEARTRAEESRNTFLESGRGAELFDRIADRKASNAERQEYIDLAERAGISRAESADLIEASREEIADLQRAGSERPAAPPQQLGFTQEGLTQQTAPPRVLDQREGLRQAEQTRQEAADPEGTTAVAKLAEIRRRGLTIDDYARQPDLFGNLPKPEEIALLRNLESGEQASALDQKSLTGTEKPNVSDRETQKASVNQADQKFGPGTMRAGEPLPEVKERKFGKRFVEDERIADDIRDIGTARYYEPIPNKVTAEQARDLVEKRGIGESIRIIRDEKNDLPAHVRATMGQIVIQKLNQTYKNLKQAGSDKAEGVLDQAVDLAEWAMEYGTRLGQGVQSFAMWSKLTPEGKLLTYKRSVDKARARHQKLFGEEVSEIVNAVNGKMTDAERAEALKSLYKTNKTARKIKTDVDKVLAAAKAGTLTDTLFYEIVGDRLGLPNYNRETAEKIMDLAHQIEQAPEGMPRNKIVMELQKFIAEQKGFDVADLPLGIFYGNILSGYNTHAVNFADTGLNVLSEINGLALNNPRAAAKVYAGMLRGFTEGRFDALLELTKGRMVTDGKWLEVPRLMEVAKFGKQGGVPIKTTSAVGRAVKRVAESKIATPLNAYKYVTRAMAASDALMFRAAKEARATVLAYRMALAEGLKGGDLETRVREILALDREGDFVAQARREGFTGSEAELRAKELREMVRDKGLSADAAEFAGEATYNHVPHGTLGLIAERVGKIAEDVKPLKLFVPFTRIVANVTNRGLNYTPYGYKRAFMGWGFGKNAEAMTAEGRRLMLTRATTGTAGLVLLGVMQEAGLIAIHGNGPSDREKRRQLQNSGWRPYSLQIGDAYISYQYSPVGLGLSILGNMKDSDRYHELEQKDAATRGAYAVARLGSTIFSQSFLSGLSRLFSALSDRPEVSVGAVKQTLGGTAAALTTPNIARDIHRLFDNRAYQSTTLMEDLIRSTPFAALALNPQLNAFGEPVKLQRQRFFDVQTSDPAWQFVVTKGLRVPVPGRTTEMEDGKRITPEQYYKLLQTTGPQIKQWILDNQQSLQLLKEQDAQDELQSAATAIRKRALDEMRGKMVKPLKPAAPPKPEAPAKP